MRDGRLRYLCVISFSPLRSFHLLPSLSLFFNNFTSLSLLFPSLHFPLLHSLSFFFISFSSHSFLFLSLHFPLLHSLSFFFISFISFSFCPFPSASLPFLLFHFIFLSLISFSIPLLSFFLFIIFINHFLLIIFRVGFRYRFALINDDGESALQVEEYFLQRLRVWRNKKGKKISFLS